LQSEPDASGGAPGPQAGPWHPPETLQIWASFCIQARLIPGPKRASTLRVRVWRHIWDQWRLDVETCTNLVRFRRVPPKIRTVLPKRIWGSTDWRGGVGGHCRGMGGHPPETPQIWARFCIQARLISGPKCASKPHPGCTFGGMFGISGIGVQKRAEI
jgi:hypothetical protein